jgi:hypothetical protein
LSDDELKAIFAYLKSTPPIHNIQPEAKLLPPPSAAGALKIKARKDFNISKKEAQRLFFCCHHVSETAIGIFFVLCCRSIVRRFFAAICSYWTSVRRSVT